MLKILWTVLFLSGPSAFAASSCIANFNSKNYAKDKECVKYATEKECLSSTDDLYCDWEINMKNPEPPSAPGKCYPFIPANGTPPSPNDGQCFTFSKKENCENKKDKYNCIWHEKNKAVTGCVPNGTSATDGLCNRYTTLEMCLSTQDNRSCKWVDPGDGNSGDAGTTTGSSSP